MLVGRRPLRHVAMLGGTGFAAGVARARRQRAERADVDRLVAALRDLTALLDSGALTPDEFEAAKHRVLSR